MERLTVPLGSRPMAWSLWIFILPSSGTIAVMVTSAYSAAETASRSFLVQYVSSIASVVRGGASVAQKKVNRCPVEGGRAVSATAL